jgi:hypothetical protein
MPHAIAQFDASLSWICLSDPPPSGALDIINVSEASRKCTVKLLLETSSTDSGRRRGFLSPRNLRRNPVWSKKNKTIRAQSNIGSLNEEVHRPS